MVGPQPSRPSRRPHYQDEWVYEGNQRARGNNQKDALPHAVPGGGLQLAKPKNKAGPLGGAGCAPTRRGGRGLEDFFLKVHALDSQTLQTYLRFKTSFSPRFD